jgi:hypothetical protein
MNDLVAVIMYPLLFIHRAIVNEVMTYLVKKIRNTKRHKVRQTRNFTRQGRRHQEQGQQRQTYGVRHRSEW